MGLDRSAWQKVVSAALVGTERQPFEIPKPFEIPTATDSLGKVFSQLKARSAEATLLLTAATIALHHRAGWKPEKYSGERQGFCDQVDLPQCCSRAAYFLQQMLQGQFPQVLPEWCAIAAKHQQRVPEQNLPDVLDVGKQRRELRTAILSILGQRGRWLAAQNPEWSYAVGVATEADWKTSGSSARSLYLQEQRSTDPDRARAWLQSTWSEESASDRAKFLETFAIGLSMADEPFLEEALSDRSKDVRRIAAEQLASLPESRLCQRMSQRLEALITLKVAAGRTFDFRLELPKTCDAAMQRDGIELKPRSGVGERAWWLLQIIRSTPLQFWEQIGKIDATEWLKIGQINEWKTVVLEGWKLAAQNQRDSQWAQAFLTNSGKMDERELKGLLDTFSPEQRAEFARKVLSGGETTKDKFVWSLVLSLSQYHECQYHEPLNDEFSRFAIARLHQRGSESKFIGWWELLPVLKALSFCVSPELSSEVASLCSERLHDSIAAEFDRFVSTLQFRHEMLKAFEPKASTHIST